MGRQPFTLESEYLFKILDSISDGIYIADKNGITLWLNKASEKVLGKPRREIIGKSISKLEQEGIYSPSAMRRAIEEKQQSVTTVQNLANGQKILVTSHLICNDENEVEYMVTHARVFSNDVRNTSLLEMNEIELLLQRYIQEIRKINIELSYSTENEHFFIGTSEEFHKLSDLISKVGSVDSTVLITGETGVGKNITAQLIHNASSRRNHPFVHINCATIPETLIESELFGYQKGAFTGANSSGKPGLVKQAEGGTLFLDEISELPLHTQSKLLQLLQNKTYMPIGSVKTLKADVRIITATNIDLEEMVKKGHFRADLFYRLNILPIKIPPLRERQEDIFHLLYYYLQKFNLRHNKKRIFSKQVVDVLHQYQWPGNIRELENLVEQLVILAKQDEISINDLPERIVLSNDKKKDMISISPVSSLTSKLEEMEKEIIEQAYLHHKTIRKTAKALGITYSLLMRRLEKYNIHKT